MHKTCPSSSQPKFQHEWGKDSGSTTIFEQLATGGFWQMACQFSPGMWPLRHCPCMHCSREVLKERHSTWSWWGKWWGDRRGLQGRELRYIWLKHIIYIYEILEQFKKVKEKYLASICYLHSDTICLITEQEWAGQFLPHSKVSEFQITVNDWGCP